MSDYYKQHPKFHIAVDCIIFGFNGTDLDLLLLRRNFEPAKGEWSLMGGFVQEDEDIHKAAERVLRELTGLDQVYLEQIKAYGEVYRDPGERVISVVYFALVNRHNYDRQLVKEHDAHWIPLKDRPHLIFDHDMMVDHAIARLRQKSKVYPIGFNLLPAEFTLTQLQKLYEAIHDRTYDKRNFRKKVTEENFIVKTGNIDKTSSKKGAALYRFNEMAYPELLRTK